MNAEAIDGERIAVADECCRRTRAFWPALLGVGLNGLGFAVEAGQDICFWWLRGGFVVLEDFHEQLGYGAGALCGRVYLGARGEGAQFGLGGDLFYGFRGGFALGFWEVEAGDLETG
jgi:hypothetical protein